MRRLCVVLAGCLSSIVLGLSAASAQDPTPATSVVATPGATPTEAPVGAPGQPDRLPANVTIVLTDYQGDIEVRDGFRLVANDAPGRVCSFTVELTPEQTKSVAETGMAQVTVPALCNSLLFIYSDIVKQIAADGSLFDALKEFTLPLSLDGKTYRSSSLKPEPSGGFEQPGGQPSGLPATGVGSDERGSRPMAAVAVVAIVGLAAMGGWFGTRRRGRS